MPAYCTKSQVEQFPNFLLPLHSRLGLAMVSGDEDIKGLMSFSRSVVGFINNLFESGVTLHHSSGGLGNDAGDGGKHGMVHQAEHHPVQLLLPDNFLDFNW